MLAFGYGMACYVLFLVTFLYLIGFLGNIAVPRSIDSGQDAPIIIAIPVNGLLLGLFGLQHSGMARPAFKRWWTRHVPRPVERSTYVLASSLLLILVFWQWRTMPEVIWNVTWKPGQWVLWSLFGLGWSVALGSTFLIDHFDLFGLRQVYAHLRGYKRSLPTFTTPGLYRYVRHPLMTGLLVAFWSIPRMTAGHLLFASGMTAYILVGLFFEERDLVRAFGERYRRYRERVPKLVPWPRRDEPAGKPTP